MSTNIIAATPRETESARRDFESWRDVGPHYKTRRQWLAAGRKVRRNEKFTARVVYPRWLEKGNRPLGRPDPEIFLNELDDLMLVTDPPTYLFHLEQTEPYKARGRTLAYLAFENIFFRHADKDCYLRRTDPKTGEDLEDWITEASDPYAGRGYLANRLTTDLIRRHVNQKQVIGVKATSKTMFVIIDLDLHDRDAKVFEDQAEVLLDRLHGRNGWHYQVKKEEVTGLQLIRVFDEPQGVKEVTQACRAFLKSLDRKYPELARAARAANMPTLGQLEIYPQRGGNGVRLPLCRDRVMLLDKPLALVTYRKRHVQDVERYVAWLNDPDRQYMDKERILDYLHYFTPLSPTRRNPPKTRTDWANGEVSGDGWQKNLKRYLYEFWIGGNANGRLLNDHIAVLCRFAAVAGHAEAVVVRRLTQFVRELPATAAGCSSRLMKRRFKQIEAVIRSSAKYACDGNGHQPDPDGSTATFEKALARWPGFDPLDKTTWELHRPSQRSCLEPAWSEEQRRQICAYLRKPLFVKDDDTIMRFVNAIVNLAVDKEREGHGWHKDYLLAWMKDRFPAIKCRKAEKRQRIIRSLEELGILAVAVPGQKGVTATKWTLGGLARAAVGLGDDEADSSGVITMDGIPIYHLEATTSPTRASTF